MTKYNYEKQYYENDALWNSNARVNSEMGRVKFTESMIPKDVLTVADIGCGNGLFLNLLNGNKTRYKQLVGIDTSQSALKYVKTNKSIGNITQIPLESASFDLVTSLEVIEHLDAEEYSLGLKELARISKKYILVSVPYREKLEDSLVECCNCKTRFNGVHHKRSFSNSYLNNLFSDFSFKNVDLRVYGDVRDMWLLTNTYHRLRRLYPLKKRRDTPCPVCGSVRASTDAGSNKKIHELKLVTTPTLKKLLTLWPKKHRFRWAMALYVRN